MKSVLSLVAVGLFSISAAVFAAPPQAAPAPAPAPAATAVTPAPVVKLTRAERKAEKKQIEATEKMALAECKKMSGAEKTACKKDAKAKEKAAMAELKAKK